METLLGLNAALGYIEDNLTGDISYAQAARLAHCSEVQFVRMFGYIAGVTLAEYIRRRRLSCAAFDLRQPGARVLEVALRYGYDSPTAFNRAFRALHGVSPSQARGMGARLKAYPRLHFQMTIKGVTEMVYRIEERPAFRIVGKKQQVSNADGENFVKIPQMWADLSKADWETLFAIKAGQPDGILGVCANMRGTVFDYYIACAATAAPPEGMEALEVPALTWAIFESVGALPHAMQEVWQRIFSEWFPASEYVRAADTLPDVEVYFEGDNTADSYRCEIWIPVVKK